MLCYPPHRPRSPPPSASHTSPVPLTVFSALKTDLKHTPLHSMFNVHASGLLLISTFFHDRHNAMVVEVKKNFNFSSDTKKTCSKKKKSKRMWWWNRTPSRHLSLLSACLFFLVFAVCLTHCSFLFFPLLLVLFFTKFSISVSSLRFINEIKNLLLYQCQY